MKREARLKRHLNSRKRLTGTTSRPRLSVFRSNKHIYAQVIDDTLGKTLIAETDLKIQEGTKTQRAFAVGKKIAQKAKRRKISELVFDRGGFLYHGRVQELARGAREGGLKF